MKCSDCTRTVKPVVAIDIDEELVQKFLSMLDHDCETGCWIFTGSYRGRGYGQFRDGRDTGIWGGYAHRFAFLIFNGRLPEKMTRHTCDRRRCCTSDHLTEGTAKQNTRDMIRRGRHGRPGLKLTDEDVEEMRRIRKDHTLEELGEMFDVHPVYAGKITRGESR